MVGVLGVLVDILNVLFGLLGVLVDILGVFVSFGIRDGVSGIFMPKYCEFVFVLYAIDSVDKCC